jgi:Flp pilus assembly protein TadD
MKSVIIICVLLAVVTLTAFWSVRRQQFVNFDDDIYVTDNPHVANGPTPESVRWAFTTTRGTHWWPLTWLSHMLDCRFFGLNAGAHKLMNVAFHTASTLLLFLVLNRMTGAMWPSAFVAALFALHPLRVESVAWVSERKDVLCTFLWMLTLSAYVRYVKRPGVVRYGWIISFFVLGLMAKPMIVTLPLVLLLLDYWPLRRTTHLRQLVFEKLPLFVLAAVASVTTYLVTHSASAVLSTETIPIGLRISNALISYVRYLDKMIWPQNLAVLYPLPVAWPMSQVSASAFLLLILSVFFVREARRHPYLIVGWLWYLVTLLPVIGLIQVGFQSMADRFTYVPLVGVFICVAWGVAEAVAGRPYARVAAGASATVVVVACVAATRVQLQFWQDSVTLFRRAVTVTSGNFVAHGNLGVALCNQDRFEEGIAHLEEAVRLSPRYAYAHNHLGRAYFSVGRTDEAIGHLRKAVELNPNDAAAHNNLGIALAQMGGRERAITEFTEAVRLRSDYALAHANLGAVLVSAGRIVDGLPHLREAVRLKPDFAEAHFYLGEALARQGKTREAREEFNAAVKLDPNLSDARRALEEKLEGSQP